MARKDGKEMHMGTLWQVWKMMDHLIVSCFMFFMADLITLIIKDDFLELSQYESSFRSRSTSTLLVWTSRLWRLWTSTWTKISSLNEWKYKNQHWWRLGLHIVDNMVNRNDRHSTQINQIHKNNLGPATVTFHYFAETLPTHCLWQRQPTTSLGMVLMIEMVTQTILKPN